MKSEKIVYRYKVKSPCSNTLVGIGFDAGSKTFNSIEEAKDYQTKYPEFFVIKVIKNPVFCLVKETVITEIVE